MLKFLIILFYYQRERIVKNALQSIKDMTYDNYEVAFIDDSEVPTGKDVVAEFFKDQPAILDKFKFYETKDTKEDKIARGGAIFGSYANGAILDITFDVGIMLCDDDFVYPSYLAVLNDYYSINPEIMHSYGHIILFNCLEEDFNDVKTRTEASDYLKRTDAINGCCLLDSSQVSWRRECSIAGNCWFSYPRTENLDADFYRQLYEKYGNCVFNGSIAQFKNWSDCQLGRHHNYDRVD